MMQLGYAKEEELEARRQKWSPPPPRFQRGWDWMFSKHFGQENTGCDFDYLQKSHGKAAGEPEIF